MKSPYLTCPQHRVPANQWETFDSGEYTIYLFCTVPTAWTAMLYRNNSDVLLDQVKAMPEAEVKAWVEERVKLWENLEQDVKEVNAGSTHLPSSVVYSTHRVHPGHLSHLTHIHKWALHRVGDFHTIYVAPCTRKDGEDYLYLYANDQPGMIANRISRNAYDLVDHIRELEERVYHGKWGQEALIRAKEREPHTLTVGSTLVHGHLGFNPKFYRVIKTSRYNSVMSPKVGLVEVACVEVGDSGKAVPGTSWSEGDATCTGKANGLNEVKVGRKVLTVWGGDPVWINYAKFKAEFKARGLRTTAEFGKA